MFGYSIVGDANSCVRIVQNGRGGGGVALTCRCGHCRPVLTGIEYELAVECHVPMKLRIIIT